MILIKFKSERFILKFNKKSRIDLLYQINKLKYLLLLSIRTKFKIKEFILILSTRHRIFYTND